MGAAGAVRPDGICRRRARGAGIHPESVHAVRHGDGGARRRRPCGGRPDADGSGISCAMRRPDERDVYERRHPYRRTPVRRRSNGGAGVGRSHRVPRKTRIPERPAQDRHAAAHRRSDDRLRPPRRTARRPEGVPLLLSYRPASGRSDQLLAGLHLTRRPRGTADGVRPKSDVFGTHSGRRPPVLSVDRG